MQSVGRDVRYGVIAAVKNPGFALVVTVTLALGIGANTAIFSVVDAVLLRPLPFPEPNRLVTVWADVTARGGPLREWLSYPNFHDLRQERDVFEEVAVWGGWNPTLTGVGEPRILTGAEVSHGMFTGVLRITPMLGRALVTEDDLPDAARVVLISHGFWTRALGADAEVLGRSVSLNDVPHTIIGVMPPGFRPPFVSDADVWRTFRIDGATLSASRGSFSFRSIGRLRQDVTLETARERSTSLARRLMQAYPDTNTGKTFFLSPLKVDLTSQAKAPLWVLMGAVFFLLVIACANVTNLMLARMPSRQSELALRAAIGADRIQLLRQLLTESAVLSLAGGVLGVVVAYVGTDVLVAIAPTETPRVDEIAVDLGVLLFATGLTAFATFSFGILPALRGARADLHGSLKRRGRGVSSSAGSRAMADTLIVGQVSLALVLLAGAGVMARSLRALNAVDLGYEPRNVLTLAVNLPRTRYPNPAMWAAFFQDLETQLGALPGVDTIGATNTVPLSGRDGDVSFFIEGRPLPRPGEGNSLWFRQVSPTYFSTVGARILRGRGFTEGDDGDAPGVMLINETLATRFFGEDEAVGRRINVNSLEQPVWRQIVGVVADVKNFGVREESRNVGYFPLTQLPSSYMAMMMRTTIDPSAIANSARTVIAKIDPALAISHVTSMDAMVNASLGAERFITLLLALFSAVALALAVIGLYGVVSCSVSRREREIGIRLAFGATARNVRTLVIGKCVLLAAAGVAIGIIGGLLLTRGMESFVFGVPTWDPLSFAAAAAVLVLVTAAASAVPAQRAVRVDPVEVLRQE